MDKNDILLIKKANFCIKAEHGECSHPELPWKLAIALTVLT